MNKTNTNPVNEPQRMTARDLLVRVGGIAHALCSAIAKTKPFMGVFKVTCSCGDVFEVGASEENVNAVRNVPMPNKNLEGTK